MNTCMKCGAELSFNEIGAYKKLINRGSQEFLCKKCLASELQITTELIDKKIEDFKAQGCLLFA